jgi:heterodisulfide reductase subunit A
MKVSTNSENVMKSRRMTIELLLSRSPEEEVLIELAKDHGLGEPRFKLKDDNCILCGLCVRMCDRMGRNAINFQGRGPDRELGTPFMELSDVCMTCGACAYICPTSRYTLKKVERVGGKKPISILSEYNEKLAIRNPIYIPFPQAIPKIPVIDKEKCVYYQTGDCKTCAEFCEAGAIEYDQEDKLEEINVGAMVIATGFDLFDPARKKEYGHGRFKNVLSNMEFERYLSATGPTEGHVIRPSDNQAPKKVAFLQCVGSRDEKTNEFCSSVCCMQAIKEAILAQEHSPGLEAHIFFMDIRAFGKEFDDYYIRAEREHGIKFTRCRVPGIEEIPETKNLILNYIEDEVKKQEEFDVVVLSCALEAPGSLKRVSEITGIELNEYGFAKTRSFTPLDSSKPGIFITGASSSPKDIPMTVADASGAAAKASMIIASERDTLVTVKEYPPEKDFTGRTPRIGVFVCHCGINIGSVVNVPSVVEYAKTLPYVARADEFIYTCSQDTQNKMLELIKEHDLNKVVVSACTPRTHEPLFQSTIREAGLNPNLFEFANIREQCSWVHMKEKDKATAKAKDLVRMAVNKAAFLEPLKRVELDVVQRALVIGGGIAGMTSALELADQGYMTYLVERDDELGGAAKNTRFILGDDDPQEFLRTLISRVGENDKIELFTGAKIKNINGFIGNFKTTIIHGGEADERELAHGVVVIATGGKEYIPTEYLNGKNDRVFTRKQLEERLSDGTFEAENVVMIQCVGSRNEERTYCSRVCCAGAVKNALKIKEKSPRTNVYVLYKDIRTYGFREKYYKKAAEKGVIFIRYDDEHKPEVSDEDGLIVSAYDPIVKRQIRLKPDMLVLSNAILPQDGTKELSQMLKLPVTKDGFFLEAHMKLRPVDFATAGVFLAGLAHSPKFIDESIAQAEAAAARACTILSKTHLESEAVVSEVDESMCSGCGFCVEACPYSAITMEDNNKALVNPGLCKGCGLCAGTCRSGAIDQKGFKDQQILSVIKSSLCGVS